MTLRSFCKKIEAESENAFGIFARKSIGSLFFAQIASTMLGEHAKYNWIVQELGGDLEFNTLENSDYNGNF